MDGDKSGILHQQAIGKALAAWVLTLCFMPQAEIVVAG
jgi:hypothetical protein